MDTADMGTWMQERIAEEVKNKENIKRLQELVKSLDEEAEKKRESIKTQMALLDASLTERFVEVDTKVETVSKKVATVGQKVDVLPANMEQKFETIENSNQLINRELNGIKTSVVQYPMKQIHN